MPSEALVEIHDVNFAYGKRPILKGMNLTFPRNKVIAIMGGSGCGKTTLLRLIGGTLKPTSGYVKVNGQVMHELDRSGLYEMRRKMGMLFQFGALFTDMSVYDNVAFQMREHTNLPEEIIHDLVLMKLHAVGLRGQLVIQKRVRQCEICGKRDTDKHEVFYSAPAQVKPGAS